MVNCPLCQFEFDSHEACAGCGLVKNCSLLRCPQCRYEFVEESKVAGRVAQIANAVRLFFLKRRNQMESGGIRPLSRVGKCGNYRIVSIVPRRPDSPQRLTVYGLAPGAELKLLHRRPSLVVRVGETEIALDKEIAGEIWVEGADV